MNSERTSRIGIRSFGWVMVLLTALLPATACRSEGVSAETGIDRVGESSLWSSLGFGGREKSRFVSIPAGTTLYVRLEQSLSSETNKTGDRFQAVLESPVAMEGDTILPAGTRLTGRLAEVADSGKVKGLASMTLRLESLSLDGKEYDLATRSITFRAEPTRKRDAKVIGGTTAAGAVIGAVAGGRKGAAVGAGVGAGSGTGYVLATKGDPVELAAETRLAFSLAHPLELTVAYGH